MTTPRSLSVLFVTLALVLTACGTSDVSSTTSTSSTVSTTSTTSTTLGAPVVDWSVIRDARYLVHGIDGIWTETGLQVWKTEPIFGPDSLVRDSAGGFVWLDTGGLWWLPKNAERPVLAAPDIVGDLIEVIDTPSGPVVRLGYHDAFFVDLATGERVREPAGGSVGYSETGNVSWLAANGLRAVIEGPYVELDDEGQPRQIIEHARLIVSRGSGLIVEFPVGTVYEPYARIHDFDGQRVILARGPYEPALPDETFTLLDLACGPCATSFRSAATWAAFTGSDSDWDGDGVAIQYRYLVAEPLRSDDITMLKDGVYLGMVQPETVEADSLSFDLAVWFTGEDANRAARDDGETEIPVPNDYYIRNRSGEIWALPVAPTVVVTSVWYNADTAPDTSGVPVPYAEFVRIMNDDTEDMLGNLRYDPWWVTIEGGEIVRLDEQYIP
ncbi:MAG: hypothetical protein HKN01_12070 [Acidimicrobiia bacterium]|nr:hypothetical protein [Acidimicrobiia bacterium]